MLKTMIKIEAIIKPFKLEEVKDALAEMGGLSPQDVENKVFAGTGRIIRTLIGGESVDLNSAMDLMSIGYVHPLMQTIFCIWAVGRAAALDRARIRPPRQ